MGGFASLNGAADVISNPSKYSFSLRAMLDSHGYIGEYEASARKINIPAMFTTGSEDHAGRLKGAFDLVSSSSRVLAEVSGADHMFPATNGALNPFDAHFLGCHVAELESSCNKVYGTGAGTMCKANSMTLCNVVNGPGPSPVPSPSPVPTPSPTPAPSPIPGGEPSKECLNCWQSACAAIEQTTCEQCMKDSQDVCKPICKPSLFGQKMMDWFCKSTEVIV